MNTRKMVFSSRKAKCPRCGNRASRHQWIQRKVYQLNRCIIDLRYSKYACFSCGLYFVAEIPGIVKGSKYSVAVRKLALAMRRDGKTLDEICFRMRRDHGVPLPISTLGDWVSEEAKKLLDNHSGM